MATLTITDSQVCRPHMGPLLSRYQLKSGGRHFGGTGHPSGVADVLSFQAGGFSWSEYHAMFSRQTCLAPASKGAVHVRRVYV